MQPPSVTSVAGSSTIEAIASAPSRDRLVTGTRLNDRYVIVDTLGQGGMGVVYRVEDLLHPGRPLALKTLGGAHLRTERVSLFKSEFRIMTTLAHPNIAAVYDLEALAGSTEHFFTMEHVAGVDLFRATEAVDTGRIVDLVVQVCRALSYLHSRKVVHLDLKPANILVDEMGQVRVLDFGVASAGQDHGPAGTPSYMAPETLSADALVDHRADLYSLGIVLYQLVMRRLPFTGHSVGEVLEKHATEPLVFDESAAGEAAWLRPVVLRLCAKDPAERYRSANAVIEDLNRLGGVTYELETIATRESYVLSSRFVGRDVERQQILDFIWEKTGSGLGGPPEALLVGGVSGVGKSRLLREIKHQAQLAGLAFVETDCYEGTFGELDPVAAALRHLTRLAGAAGASELVERVQGILRVVDAEQEPGAVLPPLGRARRQLLDEIGELFVELAEQRAFVLYFNDLQWAAPATIEVLGKLIRRLGQRLFGGQRTRLALLGTFRADEIDGHPIAALRSTLTETGDVRTLELGALDAAQVQRLLGSMLGIDDLPRAFIERVATETAGNPFFVEEIMRSLVDRGSVYLERGAWAANAPVGDLEIPASISSLLRRRAALLDSRARATLELLAIFGRPVAAAELARAARQSAEDVHESLRVLGDRQMVVRASTELVYRIGHDRMREVMVAGLTSDHRRRLHVMVAEALEGDLMRDGALVHEVATHFFHGGDRARALRYSLLAGEQAQAGYTNALASEHFERALALMDEDLRKGPSGLAVREKLADLQGLMGRYEPALSSYREVFGALDGKLPRARLLRKMGQVHQQAGDLERALGPLWDAVERLGGRRTTTKSTTALALPFAAAIHLGRRIFGVPEPVADAEERARLLELAGAYRIIAEVCMFLAPKMMIAPLLAACNAGERAGDSSELCHIYTDLAFTYNYLGMNASAAALGDRALDTALRLRAPLEIGVALVFRGMIWSNQGDYRRALPLCQRGKALLLEHGDLFVLTIAESNIGNVLFWQGSPRAAMDGAEAVVQLVERTGSLAFGKFVVASAGYYRALLGDRAGAAMRFEQAASSAVAAKDQTGMLGILAMRGHSELALGDIGAAVQTLQEARALAVATGSRLYVLGLLLPALALARLEAVREVSVSQRRELAEISAIVREGLAYTARRRQYRAYALLARAVLAWRRRERGWRKLFDDCHGLASAQGNEWVCAEASLELGRALLEHGGAIDEGSALIDRASVFFERSEMAPHLARCRRLKATCA